jgi:uncharacterized spore protein YtfJ
MIDQDQAMDDAREAADATPADRLIERLAELIGAKAEVRSLFGEPVRQGGVPAIPVARIRWGLGGGGGRSDAAPDGPAAGSGGGGGVAADPIGYVEIGSDGAALSPATTRDAQRRTAPIALAPGRASRDPTDGAWPIAHGCGSHSRPMNAGTG